MTTQSRLKELFDYVDGQMIRRIPVSNVLAGTVAGSTAVNKYVVIYVDGRPYKAHRLVWMFHHSTVPKILDHIDGNPSNNRIENLRAATPSENSRNSRQKAGNKGIGRHNGRWRARICVGYRSHFLGHFKTKEDAIEAYNKAAIAFHGEFACLNK